MRLLLAAVQSFAMGQSAHAEAASPPEQRVALDHLQSPARR